MAAFSFSSGARAGNSRTVCPNEEIALECPDLESVIRNKTFLELVWKVADSRAQSKKPNVAYCNESVECTRYRRIGSFEQRIKIRNPVQGTLFVTQLVLDDQLTYTCHIERKENKPPVVNNVNVSSSKRCKYN